MNKPNHLENKILNKALNAHQTGNIHEAKKYYKLFIEKGFTNLRVFNNFALIQQQDGNYSEAVSLYKKSIQLYPNDPKSYTNLSGIMKAYKKFDEAELLIRKALSLKVDYAEANLILGEILLEKGNLKEAEKYMLTSLKSKPNSYKSHYNLGLISNSLGQLEQAERYINNAIILKPDFLEGHFNLGAIFKVQKKFIDAEKSTLKAIEINPNIAEAFDNLASIYQATGKLKQAEIAIKKSIALNPNLANSHYTQALILHGKGSLVEAEKSLLRAININSNFAEAYNNLGAICIESPKLKEAEIYTKKAISIKSNYALAHCNLGTISRLLNKPSEAIKAGEKAIELDPSLEVAYINLAESLQKYNEFSKAIEILEVGLKLQPINNKIKFYLLKLYSKICNWELLGKNINWLNETEKDKESLELMTIMYLEDDPIKEFERAKQYYQHNYSSPQKDIALQKKNKIRIGYFSYNFCLHSTMVIFAHIIELHDKDKFDIFIYDFGLKNDEDSYKERIKQSVTNYKSVKDLSNKELINLARHDQIDIAIDLMGYTSSNRAMIFSNRIAPIQVSYLDYPGSTGNDSMDYIIADKILIPEQDERFYTEKVLRLPHAVQPTDDTLEPSDKLFKRSDFGLDDHSFVFCCFSKNEKIQSKEFKIWMNLLLKNEESLLWLMQSNDEAKENIQLEATRQGVNPSRIIFATKVPLREHISRQKFADLALDTFNFSSGVLTNLALKVGLPILTFPGKTYSSRLTTSILDTLGLKELIALDERDYQEKALRFSLDRTYTSTLREKILSLKRSSPYFDSQKYCNNLEKGFRDLYESHSN